ncbi:hypothetical protein ACI78V_09525 [Geodermatophilus sp. SYSU D00742]
MALLTRYDTPAGLRDLPEGSGFYEQWHEVVDRAVTPFSTGPWIDPTVVDPEVVAVRTLSWIGFPRASLTVQRRDDRAQAFEDAEEAGDAEVGFRPKQVEYFEWFTTRDRETGKVTKVTFSTESPEYFDKLAAVDRRCVEALYQQHVDPRVRWEELTNPDGTYNRSNRWTTTRGIMHFVNSANDVTIAVGLAQTGAAATVPDPGVPDAVVARDNFEMATRGENAADDYLVREVAALARSGLDITVHDPVGLYIDGWDDTGWTKPDGTPVGDYWTITRGRPGAVLRLDYEVPPEEGFQVGDIRIGGRPVVHGGQLAEHMTSSLPVVVARRPTS